nr:hypothetical protein [Escherichia coli]
MLRMTPLASAIVALLLGIEAYAAEETFDTDESPNDFGKNH